MSKFYHFSQNNSGGHFDFDKDAGITHHVIVEADTVDQASARAQDIGIYYEGVRDGRDCGCCGDRWYEPWGDGDAEPMVYSNPFKEWNTGGFLSGGWMDAGHEVCVHYLDGRKEWA